MGELQAFLDRLPLELQARIVVLSRLLDADSALSLVDPVSAVGVVVCATQAVRREVAFVDVHASHLVGIKVRALADLDSLVTDHVQHDRLDEAAAALILADPVETKNSAHLGVFKRR